MPTRTILDETWEHGTRHVLPGQPNAAGRPAEEELWEVLLLDRATRDTIVYTMTKAKRDHLISQLVGPRLVLADIDGNLKL
jgi:hypothetical protein